MSGRALPDKSAPRVAVGPRVLLQKPGYLIGGASASTIAACLLGTDWLLGRLTQLTFLTALVFVCWQVAHWLRWFWRKQPPLDKTRDWRELRRRVVLQIRFGFFATALLGFLLAAHCSAIGLGPVPLAWLLSGVVVVVITAAVLDTHDLAVQLELERTTEALRHYLNDRGADRKAEHFAKAGLWRRAQDWLGERLGDSASAVALALSVVPLLVFAEATVALGGVEAGRGLEHQLFGSKATIVTGASQGGSTVSTLHGGGSTEQGCALEPGTGASGAAAEELFALWYGDAKTGKKGKGNLVAGCPQQAEREPGRRGVWIERGLCHGNLRGLAVVAPGRHPPGMLIQQGAAIGTRLADEGVLRGASSRWRVGEGDLYTLQTSRGSYVAVRAHRTGGAAPGDIPSSPGCGAFADRNVPYQLVVPGAIGIWLMVAERGWAWPVEHRDGSRRDYVFILDSTGEEVGEASCVDDLRCSGSYRGETLPSIKTRVTSTLALASLAPQG